MPEETKPCRHGDDPNQCISCQMLAQRPSKREPTRATEETKPVEREAFDEWFSEEFEELNPLGQEARAIRMVWDAALERAAQVADNMAHDLESRADGCDVQGLLTSVLRQRAIARGQVADAIRALKGSR